MSTTKKLIMKKTILVILILLTASEINAQQDPQYTQYMYNMNVINPAYAGSSDATSIGILYRDQWEGLEGAPKTATMNVHFPAGNNVGFGFSAISDEIGPVSETNLYIDFSYTLNLANENRLAFGIKAGGKFHDIDFARLEILKLLAEDERMKTRVFEDYSNLHAIENADFLIQFSLYQFFYSNIS